MNHGVLSLVFYGIVQKFFQQLSEFVSHSRVVFALLVRNDIFCVLYNVSSVHIDSFTDYQGDSPQDRTQLNINAKKKLFDDRLVVTAGSAVDVEGSSQATQGQTPLIGNVSLEYLLTEDGRYRLKGYRKNEYENVIDGQLIVTGLALIFNREFNRFSQLFNPLKEDANTEEAKSEE